MAVARDATAQWGSHRCQVNDHDRNWKIKKNDHKTNGKVGKSTKLFVLTKFAICLSKIQALMVEETRKKIT